MGDAVKGRGRVTSVAAIALLVLGVMLGGTTRVHAQGGAVCTVRVIQARQAGSEFDPRLQPLHRQLSQPPFSAWQSFRLIQQHDINLPRDQRNTFALPGEHQGALTYLGRVDGPKRHRVRVRLELHDSAAHLVDTVFLLDDGGTLLQGGIRNAGGTLVLGFTCHLHEGP